ncbi:hypothetical protein K432DRAFT_14322 [Lepidopterella palustris CBS 459.81]|uniref:Uncharacterized protein n=1 Tax=Lepidopterella palustris CBS 459.81 TaxID=1314670 RepID=A0A8E2ECS1_9PEZI|nr:hypothetical protein K432DRAFT_14322 [Lepidopterella palustris CBS 459.81]
MRHLQSSCSQGTGSGCLNTHPNHPPLQHTSTPAFITKTPPDPHSSNTNNPTLSTLLLAEQFTIVETLGIFTCAVCLPLQHAGNFADNFRKGRWGREGDKRGERFCIACGTWPPKGGDKRLRYKKGDAWTRFGLVYVNCKVCIVVKRGMKERRGCEVCPGCWDKGKGRI